MKRLVVPVCCMLALGASGMALAQGSIPYLSGGIGEEEHEALLAQAKDYNLQLLFATRGSGEYIASVRVSVLDGAGKPVLTAEGAGPWFYARLPEGRYRVLAETAGNQQSRWIRIVADKPAKAYFYWPEGNGSGR